MTIGIIGGGIAGLAAAIAMARQGRDVTVYERAAHFTEVGAGLQIGPNAISALKQIGAFEAIAATAFAPSGIRIMDGLKGRQLGFLPLGEEFEKWFGEPYRVTHRADLLAGLLACAKSCTNIDLKNDRTLKSLEVDKDKPVCHFSNDQTSTHALIIGADGFRSTTRRYVLNDGPPVFFGHTLYRALLPMSEFKNLDHPLDVHLWMYPGGHVVHYPVSGGSKLNIVAATESNWEHRSWNTPATNREVLAKFPKAANAVLDVLEQPEGWLKWAAAGHPPSESWHTKNTVLIGDAIHAGLPYFAQGAAMAIEDGVCLAHFLKSGGNLDLFTASRKQRTDKAVKSAARLGKIYHLSGPARLARNMVIRNTSTRQQYERLSWLYSWQAPSI